MSAEVLTAGVAPSQHGERDHSRAAPMVDASPQARSGDVPVGADDDWSGACACAALWMAFILYAVWQGAG